MVLNFGEDILDENKYSLSILNFSEACWGTIDNKSVLGQAKVYHKSGDKWFPEVTMIQFPVAH